MKLRVRTKNTVLILLAVCMLFLCAAGAAESMHQVIENPAFDLEVSVGYDGLMIYGKPMPVRVTIRNYGEDLEGVLGMNAYVSNREYDRWEMPVAVPAGSRREYILPLTVYARQDIFTAEFVKDGEVICAAGGSAKNVINPSAMMIGVLSTRPQSMNNMNISPENDSLSRYERWQTVPLTAENFPEELNLLQSFGMLVIDDIDPATLSRKQQETLDAWLKSGRILLCGGGTTAARNIPYFSGYTGLTLLKVDTSEDVVGGLESLIGRSVSGKAVPVSTAKVTGASSLAPDMQAKNLVWRTTVGAGRIYTMAFEAGDTRLNSENLMHYFWQQLLVNEDQNLYSNIQYMDSSNSASGAVNAGSSVPVNARSLVLPGLLIVAGALAAACIAWWILKKMDKRQWMWAAMPLISVLTAAVILLLSAGSQANRPLAVITENLVQDDTGATRAYYGIAVASPAFGRHRYETDGNKIQVQTYDYVDYDDYDDDGNERKEPTVQRTCNTIGGVNAVTTSSMSPWEMECLTSESTGDIQGRIEGEVWMEEDGLHGEVVNGTDQAMAKGYVLTSYGYCSIPALAPGEKAEFAMIRAEYDDPKEPKHKDGGYYVTSPNMYTVVYDALDRMEEERTDEEKMVSSMVSSAMDVMQRGHDNQYYGSQENTLFLYTARPEDRAEKALSVDGKPVELKNQISQLSAALEFTPVGRTGIVFRSVGMDVPVRVETDDDMKPTSLEEQSGRRSYYHSLNETPTFLFTLKGVRNIRINYLRVMIDSYYSGQVKLYALNASTREWEEIDVNEDVKDPERYLDPVGRLYIQCRNGGMDMYADIPTPMITLEGRQENAEN